MFYSVFLFFLQSVQPIYEKGSARVRRVDPNSHKIFQIAPTLRIDAVTKKTSQSVPPIYIKKTAQNTYIRGSLWQFFFYIYWLVTLVILTWPGAGFGPKTVPKKGVEATVLSIDGQKPIAPRRGARIKTSAGPRGG